MELSGIGFGTMAGGRGYGLGPTVPVAGALSLEAPAIDQLVADSRESSANVSALAAYSGALPLGSAALPSPAALTPPALPASGGALASPATSSFTPARSWTSLAPQGGSDPDGSGASADAALADLVGGGDVFGAQE